MPSLSPPPKRQKRFPDWERREDDKLECPRCHKLISAKNGSYSGVSKHETACKKQYAEAHKTDTKMLELFVNNGVTAECESLLIEFVINSGSPLSLVDDKHFKKFLAALNRNYKPPSRRTLSGRIHNKMENHFQAVAALLRATKSVNITMDVWSRSSKSSFLSIVGHTLINNNLKAIVLDFRKLDGRHNAELIASVLKDVVVKCGLSGRVRALTSDAAAVNVKAVRQLTDDPEFSGGQEICHFLCAPHKLHLCVSNSLSLWGGLCADSDSVNDETADEVNKQTETCMDDGGSEDDLSDWLVEDSDSDEDINEKGDLAWASGIEAHVRRNNRPISSTLVKLRAHSRLVRQSCIGWSLLQECIKKEKDLKKDKSKVKIIPRDIITRWNSTMYLLRWFINDVNKAGFKAFQTKCLQLPTSDRLRKHMVKYKLDVDDYANAENVCSVITDIELATKLFSGSKYCSLSLLRPVIRSLVSRLSLKTDGRGRVAKMARDMLDSLTHYFKYVLDCQGTMGSLLVASTYLHPRYASTEELIAGQTAVRVAAEYYSVETDTEDTKSNMVLSSGDCDVVVEDDHFLNCLDRRELSDLPANMSILERELDIYERELHSGKHRLVDFVTYWINSSSSMPTLSTIALELAKVPVSSVSAEESFSVAGSISRSRRASLSSSTLRALMLLREA